MMTEMTERERIARLIADRAWRKFDSAIKNQRHVLANKYLEERKESMEAADRLIAAGLTLREASVAVPVYGGK